jgi:hypothetical protein
MRGLKATVIGLGAVMAGVAVYAIVASPGAEELNLISSVEIMAAAALVLPWFVVYSHKVAARFTAEDAAAAAWRSIGVASLFLLGGNLCAYLPGALGISETGLGLSVTGQVLPATFRLVMVWSMIRVQVAFAGAGVTIHQGIVDYLLGVLAIAASAFLVSRQHVLVAYWTSDIVLVEESAALGFATVFNFILYPIVFFLSLRMYRCARGMGGGLVARAWAGVALYGLLQLVHTFLVALLRPYFGAAFTVVVDNFVVLAAFTCLAAGPIYQLRAMTVRAGG